MPLNSPKLVSLVELNNGKYFSSSYRSLPLSCSAATFTFVSAKGIVSLVFVAVSYANASPSNMSSDGGSINMLFLYKFNI